MENQNQGESWGQYKIPASFLAVIERKQKKKTEVEEKKDFNKRERRSGGCLAEPVLRWRVGDTCP